MAVYSLVGRVERSDTRGTARVEARIAAAEIAALRVEESLRGALVVAAWRSAVGDLADPEADVLLEAFTLNGMAVKVRRSPETGKLDINLSEEADWRALFLAAGAEQAAADRLAAQIADWIDADDLPRPNGAERADYAGVAGKFIGDRRFGGARELLAVKDMTPELYDKVAPYLTLFGAGGASQATLGDLSGGSALPEDLPPRAVLGTAARGASPGARIVLRAEFAGGVSGASPRALEAAYRVTGAADAPVERIATLRD